MNTLSSTNPDQKISALATIHNSQNFSNNLNTTSMEVNDVNKETIFDLKFCLFYAHREMATDVPFQGKSVVFSICHIDLNI